MGSPVSVPPRGRRSPTSPAGAGWAPRAASQLCASPGWSPSRSARRGTGAASGCGGFRLWRLPGSLLLSAMRKPRGSRQLVCSGTLDSRLLSLPMRGARCRGPASWGPDGVRSGSDLCRKLSRAARVALAPDTFAETRASLPPLPGLGTR